MRAPDWLTARPVAHRGLHDISRGIVENMPAAAQAAVDGNFAIECDIQLSSDGEAMVHHDDALGRLTEGSGALLGKTAAELKAVTFKNTPERMMTLGDLCSLVAGRVPLVIEVKSHFDGDRRLVTRMADVLAGYDGPAVGMSFDPDQVVALRELIPGRARGIVAEREYTAEEWPEASAEHADADAQQHPDPYANVHVHAEQYADPHADAHSKQYGHEYTDVHLHAEQHPHPHADAHSEQHGDEHADVHVYAE